MSGRTFTFQSSWDDVFAALGLDTDTSQSGDVADSMNQQLEEFLNRYVITSTNDDGDVLFDAAGTYTFQGTVNIGTVAPYIVLDPGDTYTFGGEEYAAIQFISGLTEDAPGVLFGGEDTFSNDANLALVGPDLTGSEAGLAYILLQDDGSTKQIYYNSPSGHRFTDGQILGGDGTAAAPSASFINTVDMGLYRAADNVLGVAVNGGQVARFNSSGYLVLSQASNRLVMATDEASYMEYSDAVDEWIFVTDGTAEMTLSTTALIVPNVYSNTTATAANVNVHTNGSIRRSTSSRAIKANERPLADDGFLDLIQAVAYWSIPDERPLWGFIAEDMAEINPRFTDGETDHISDRAIIAKLVARVQALTREVRG